MAHHLVSSTDRALDRNGETITLRRVVPNGSPIDVQVRARVTGYAPEELVGGIMQGDRRVVLSASSVAASTFPLPIKPNDRIVVRGRLLNIQDVDESTCRIGGQLVAYEIRATGRCLARALANAATVQHGHGLVPASSPRTRIASPAPAKAAAHPLSTSTMPRPTRVTSASSGIRPAGSLYAPSTTTAMPNRSR
jgi:hypothetical protein